MDLLGQVGVDDSVVEVAIDGSRVEGLIKLGWFSHQALDGIGVGFALLRSHGIEVDSGFDIVVGTLLVLSRKVVVHPVVDVGPVMSRTPWLWTGCSLYQ